MQGLFSYFVATQIKEERELELFVGECECAAVSRLTGMEVGKMRKKKKETTPLFLSLFLHTQIYNS